MLRIKDTLKKGLESCKEKGEPGESCINELAEKVSTTRTLVQFAHWGTNSDAAHRALASLYEQIVSDTDSIVEAYQGEFELLKGLCCYECKQPADIIAHIKSDAEWVKAHRSKIACGSTAIESLVDNLLVTYNTVLYKLKNLH